MDDVVGAVPNVPLFLSGHPQCMRRRERTVRDNAPLTVFMDLSSSMSIKSDSVLRRGIVLLALVRQLLEHRPVELWVGASLSDSYSGKAGTVVWRIDTTPLDLARAAFHIADTSMSRVFGYAMCESMTGIHMGRAPSEKDTLRVVKETAGWGEVLFVPAIFSYDPMVSDPVKWLKSKMSEHIRTEEDA